MLCPNECFAMLQTICSPYNKGSFTSSTCFSINVSILDWEEVLELKRGWEKDAERQGKSGQEYRQKQGRQQGDLPVFVKTQVRSVRENNVA